MQNTTLIGYSSNDFFYEKPDYCGVKNTEKKYEIDGTTETSTMEDIDADKNIENQDDDTVSDIKKTLCITNEKYGKLIKETNSGLTSSNSRYEYTLKMYNRELLRTINYIAGIALLGAYIYVNQKMK
jgi:hypothetical protein